jgi:hypothetical protein
LRVRLGGLLGFDELGGDDSSVSDLDDTEFHHPVQSPLDDINRHPVLQHDQQILGAANVVKHS